MSGRARWAPVAAGTSRERPEGEGKRVAWQTSSPWYFWQQRWSERGCGAGRNTGRVETPSEGRHGTARPPTRGAGEGGFCRIFWGFREGKGPPLQHQPGGMLVTPVNSPTGLCLPPQPGWLLFPEGPGMARTVLGWHRTTRLGGGFRSASPLAAGGTHDPPPHHLCSHLGIEDAPGSKKDDPRYVPGTRHRANSPLGMSQR